MSAVAQITDLVFAYPERPFPAIDCPILQIDHGDLILVVGRSGTGKSTLLRSLNGLVPHFSGGRFGGQVRVGDLDTRTFGPRELSSLAGLVSQEPESQLLSGSVIDEIAFSLEQHGVERQLMRKRVEEVLDVVSVAHLRDRQVSTLSGGERQRVAIASAIAMQPQLLLLDEPTSQLDPGGSDEVVSALLRLNEDLGMSIVVSEHRLDRLISHATGVVLMETNRPTRFGLPRKVLGEAEVDLLPPVSQLGRRLNWLPLPLNLREGRRFLADLPSSIPFPVEPQEPGAPVLRIEGLDAGYRAAPVIRDLSLEVREGETVVLMGRNGSGKTTLLRSIAGLQPITHGAIRLAGEEISGIPTARLADRIGFLPQRARSLLFAETVQAEMAIGTERRNSDVAEIARTLEQLGLEGFEDRHPRDTSVGEQERIALAATVIGNPPLLLLDEPTRGMDYLGKRRLAGLLKQMSDHGAATIMATHDVELAAIVASRVIILGGQGEIVADGPPRQILAGSGAYATQVNRLLGGEALTVEDAIALLRGVEQGGSGGTTHGLSQG